MCVYGVVLLNVIIIYTICVLLILWVSDIVHKIRVLQYLRLIYFFSRYRDGLNKRHLQVKCIIRSSPSDIPW